MIFLLASFGCFFMAAVLVSLLKNQAAKRWVGCGGVLVGSVLGLIPSIQVLANGMPLAQNLGAPIPSLNISLGVDPLSAFFLIAIFVLSGVIALYSLGYLKGQAALLSSLPFFPLLVAAMAAVVIARDGFFFLICWEIMSLTSFFLVTSEHEIREVRHAGWIYLIATHLATALLMAFFVLLFKQVGSFSFYDFANFGALSPRLAGILFVLAVVGFGTKAGIFPFHVWLPHAHPAAPSYISALMSAVMIKTGIYGILRALTFLGAPPLWWGEVLLGLGILSSVLGALYALVQKDLKKLLAYSSVENIGIIVMGIGLGLIGVTRQESITTLLGFGGALLHVWNHALLKGGLFLGAGIIVHVTHTRILERMGGLIKIIPTTGGLFIFAALGIVGLPPLNGFISEWLLYQGLFHGIQSFTGFSIFLSIAGIVGIALTGGLILAAFTKVIGVALLGEGRDPIFHEKKKSSWTHTLPLIGLAAISLSIAIFPQAVWSWIIATLQPYHEFISPDPTANIFLSLRFIGRLGFILLIFCAGLILLHRFRILKLGEKQSVTWDCGYRAPSPRMQYSASSFAESLAVIFRGLLKLDWNIKKPTALFPATTQFSEYSEDRAEANLFRPLFASVATLFSITRKVQPRRIQWYLGLIFIVLLSLFFWEVWFGI